MGWKYNDDELFAINEANSVVGKLRLLPPDTRNVFTIMIQRSSHVKGWGDRIIISEIEAVTGNTGRIVDHQVLLQTGISQGRLSEIEQDSTSKAV